LRTWRSAVPTAPAVKPVDRQYSVAPSLTFSQAQFFRVVTAPRQQSLPRLAPSIGQVPAQWIPAFHSNCDQFLG
jgi:hypothetical protein